MGLLVGEQCGYTDELEQTSMIKRALFSGSQGLAT